MKNVAVMLCYTTYAAFPKLFCIDGRSEVEAPGVVSHRILPVHEAFGGLTDTSA